MKERECAGCGKTYTMRDYGSGWKYCSALCRHTKGGTVELDDKLCWPRGGRPGRFPEVNEAERERIKKELEEHGWHVGPFEDATYGLIDEMAMIQRGMKKPIRIGFGGGFHQRWAHVIAFPDPMGKTMVRSNCVRKVHDEPVETGFNWKRPGHRFYRGPCYAPRCLKCNVEREIRAVSAVVDRLNAERKLDSDGQSEGLQGA